MINSELLKKALITTPHIAGYSAQGKANATAAVVAAAAERFSLPLKGWYPEQVRPATRVPISWEEMCSTIEKYCPLMEQSEELKSHPEEFESLRNNYSYREEYF
jgi:erythronate-4-phosphate dehydrogenase